ncbi:chloride channel protein EriC [Prevotella dentalis DSM 3688]|uniref:Chloride channel protein n=1 Tax=Prevotella dentalis (strain ATCC 49559 / DSM 3688 / JCM 13448 / NCTC 12043 / ES 2772) TaxID=908937 RepID=F9D5V1_PREDD|nr:chloride channel protein [Prevotella dentalis]AGB29325.1 chloride channel protein EriC [Prevotella dentalis DSM 3688]EGQ12974.1 chloride channel protein [Prevotella dentalis DSM 3688]
MTDKLIAWREAHLTDKQATSVLAFAIGILASVAAYVLHLLIRLIEHLLTEDFISEAPNWLYLVFPVIGIYLTSLFIKYIVRDNISHGITRVLYAISTKQSRIKAHNCWSSVVASAITIGFGGSVGAEAPIVLTGSAIGSRLGQLFGMDRRTVMLLVGCGCAAAISGIFKAPIAGLVFTLEVLMIDMTMNSLVPILVASITADIFSYLFTGTSTLFAFHLDGAWAVERVPPTILLGVFCGMVSLYFMRTMTFCEGQFARMKNHPYGKLLVGGLLLSSLIFLFPSLYGEGYSALDTLIGGKTEADWSQVMDGSLFYGHSELLVVYVSLVMLTKIVATSSTNGAGGCGGTFAPSLFVGGFAGFLFARLWNMEQLGVYLPEKNFTLLGMAGVMAGVMHAPLTGIFLIAEITGGYALFVPLIVVAVVSVMFISIFEPHSIYAMRLAREGKLVTHHTDKSVLTMMNMASLVEKEAVSVDPDMSMGRLVNVLTSTTNSFIPVLDEDRRLLGVIDIGKIRHIVFRTELYQKFRVSQIMTPPPATLYDNEPMQEVMAKFDATHAEVLPVVDINNRLRGYVSKARMYSVYRQMVADFSAE